ncbi:DUF4199 domain-containing protein [Confluentibacter flavum]|uniref:DUF4199 domain-containing protein n=1 Tax=Confluentibacter flavum TaxID=1909700 RepID=A0A2N3HI78_9FLAO|nr:DUF4199 domain-containing protein [Confluentibacter flavum]PKQ44675.1 DUF4199 domain-containing protein [Confluentibacter flavum]
MKSSASVAIKYGVFTALTLIIYFLALKLIGLHNNPWFRIFNGPIMAYAIYVAIKNFKNSSGSEFDYGSGFKTGLSTGFIATVLFAAFMCIYMFYLDTAFTNNLLRNWFSDFDYGSGILVFIILIEGLASTVVLTLTCMQLFKNSKNFLQNK